MSSTAPDDDQHRTESAEVSAGIRRRLVQITALFLVQGAVLFGASGNFGWVWAWLFLTVQLAGVMLNMAILLRRSPVTIAERADAHGMKTWDKIVGGLWAVSYFLALLCVAGLDIRYGWTGAFPIGLRLLGLAGMIAGTGLIGWAMISNAHFDAVARVRMERGHRVCSSGPYRWIRHPGYLAAMVQAPALALMLGSFWALIPAAAAAALMIARTHLEDRMLLQELDGYAAYSRAVRYRLIPRLW